MAEYMKYFELSKKDIIKKKIEIKLPKNIVYFLKKIVKNK
jgi:hypothetical protein